MVACSFCAGRRHAGLVAQVGTTVFQLLTGVERVAYLFKVLLHHIDKRRVVAVVDAWVAHHQDTKFVETLCHVFALIFPTFLLFQVGLNIDDGNLSFGFRHSVV